MSSSITNSARNSSSTPSSLLAKVADFGGSRFGNPGDEEAALTMTAGVGTPAYIAPELTAADIYDSSSGNSKYSNKIDVYSFALTAWSCVMRDTPYANIKAGSIFQLRTQVANGLRPKISAEAFAQYVAANPGDAYKSSRKSRLSMSRASFKSGGAAGIFKSGATTKTHSNPRTNTLYKTDDGAGASLYSSVLSKSTTLYSSVKESISKTLGEQWACSVTT
jgi:serine/threonine protein kinase